MNPIKQRLDRINRELSKCNCTWDGTHPIMGYVCCAYHSTIIAEKQGILFALKEIERLAQKNKIMIRFNRFQDEIIELLEECF